MQKTFSKNFKVAVTSNFKKEAKSLSKKYPSLKSDLFQLVETLEVKPETGVALGKNCFKSEWRSLRKEKVKVEAAELLLALKLLLQQYIFSQFMTNQEKKAYRTRNWMPYSKLPV